MGTLVNAMKGASSPLCMPMYSSACYLPPWFLYLTKAWDWHSGGKPADKILATHSSRWSLDSTEEKAVAVNLIDVSRRYAYLEWRSDAPNTCKTRSGSIRTELPILSGCLLFAISWKADKVIGNASIYRKKGQTSLSRSCWSDCLIRFCTGVRVLQCWL